MYLISEENEEVKVWGFEIWEIGKWCCVMQMHEFVMQLREMSN